MYVDSTLEFFLVNFGLHSGSQDPIPLQKLRIRTAHQGNQLKINRLLMIPGDGPMFFRIQLLEVFNHSMVSVHLHCSKCIHIFTFFQNVATCDHV